MSSMSCGHPCVEAKYYFSMTEAFSPEKDSITVGDTLWITSSHSTIFLDSITRTNIDFSNSHLGSPFEILNFPDTSQNVIGAVNDFEYLINYGALTDNDSLPNQNKSFSYEEINSEYRLKVGIIAKKKGIYAISVGDDISVAKKNKGCEKAFIQIINDNSNSHLYYYQNFRPTYQISNYEKTHLYCFKVY
jgi:hypothetical protein